MQCTARSKRTGERCKAQAMKGKDKCRMHGGSTPVKHGLYSKYTKGILADRIEELKNDPALTDLREHIALMITPDIIVQFDRKVSAMTTENQCIRIGT